MYQGNCFCNAKQTQLQAYQQIIQELEKQVEREKKNAKAWENHFLNWKKIAIDTQEELRKERSNHLASRRLVKDIVRVYGDKEMPVLPTIQALPTSGD